MCVWWVYAVMSQCLNQWWLANISSGNGRLPSDYKPLSENVLANFYVDKCYEDVGFLFISCILPLDTRTMYTLNIMPNDFILAALF